MRLFVAVNLPESIKTELEKLKLRSSRGVRWMRTDQMHITVHFIGDANAEAVRQALGSVEFRPLHLSITGVGCFRLNGGRKILWAGVSQTDDLLELHDACGRALIGIGVKVETRRYMPHVTLARLKPFADESIVETFVSDCDNRDFGDFVAEQFVLYNSVNGEDGARYEAVATYPPI